MASFLRVSLEKEYVSCRYCMTLQLHVCDLVRAVNLIMPQSSYLQYDVRNKTYLRELLTHNDNAGRAVSRQVAKN